MIHRYRRTWVLVAVLAGVAGLVAAPAGALAAVAPDATLTVRFVDAVTLLAIDRAAIHVTAHQDGAVIGEFDGETDATGIAVLIDLPREAGEGGAVRLDVIAHKETSFTDGQTGCVFNDTWDAARLAVPVDGAAIEVEFTADEQQTISSLECPPDQVPPTGDVGGIIGTPGPTLPATDSLAGAGSSETPGALVVAGGLLVASAGFVFLVPRRRLARRRARTDRR